MGRIAIINLTFFGTWISTAVWRALTPGRSLADQLVRTHLELQATFRSARLHERWTLRSVSGRGNT
jgi:hypothetical protein